jgi:hypothetical protein
MLEVIQTLLLIMYVIYGIRVFYIFWLDVIKNISASLSVKEVLLLIFKFWIWTTKQYLKQIEKWRKAE